MSKLLIKYASRSRPNRLFQVIDSVFKNVSNPNDVVMVLSFDKDDTTVYNKGVIERLTPYLKKYNIKAFFSDRTTKVNALNRDIDKIEDWDKVLFISDYTEITKNGFEQDILSKKGDVVLFPSSNSNGIEYHCLYCFSKSIYDKYGFIYNPKLASNFLEEEIEIRLNKPKRDTEIISFHKYLHPLWGYYDYDNLLLENQSNWKDDLQFIEAI